MNLHNLPDTLLAALSEFIATRIGLRFPPERWNDLERGIKSAAREFKFGTPAECVEWLVSSPLTKQHIETLASHLTIGETFFFREKNSLEALEERVLPRLIRSRQNSERRLRLWSAGCCTGEEPYSIAILLTKLIPRPEDWDITILATDINPEFLRKASLGVYQQWSFRDTPSWVKERYFTKTREGHLEILPHIKRLVKFAYLNLAEDVYPSLLNNTNGMDVILCRNVLMYFDPERAEHVLQRFHRSLLEGGWLIVSPTEASRLFSSQFLTVTFPGAILYQKDGGQSQATGDSALRKQCSYVLWNEKTAPLLPPFEFAGEPALQVVRPAVVSAREGRETQEATTPETATYEEASALYEQGRYAETAHKLTKLMGNDHEDIKAMTLLARAYANQGRLTDALTWCDRSLAADKLIPHCHYLRATILQEQGQVEEAAHTLRQALYLDPKFVIAHFALGNLMLNLGRPQESRKCFENALSLLSSYGQEEPLPESEGLTAGRLSELIVSFTQMGALA